jgi:hypothetical protein
MLNQPTVTHRNQLSHIGFVSVTARITSSRAFRPFCHTSHIDTPKKIHLEKKYLVTRKLKGLFSPKFQPELSKSETLFLYIDLYLYKCYKCYTVETILYIYNIIKEIRVSTVTHSCHTYVFVTLVCVTKCERLTGINQKVSTFNIIGHSIRSSVSWILGHVEAMLKVNYVER